MPRFISIASLCLFVSVPVSCANQSSQSSDKKANQPNPPNRPETPKNAKQDAGVLSVAELSKDRNKYLNKKVRVRGSSRLVQEIVGMHNPGMIQTEIICILERTELENIRARFNGDASGTTERTLTIEGEVFKLRSEFPGMENALMMRKCKIIK